MSRVSRFEHELIDAALIQAGPEIPPGTAAVLIPNSVYFLLVFREAISPALADCDFRDAAESVFDSGDWISDAVRWILAAELIIADVTDLNPDVMYLLGLCHGLGRCPLLIAQEPTVLPRHLEVFRCLRYVDDPAGLRSLREGLARAIRVFVTQAAASRKKSEP